MISVHFQGKPFNITVIQVYAQTPKVKEAEIEQFYDDLQDLLELTPKKRCPFHHRGLECKRRKSRNTWSNRQVWPWSIEAGQRLTEICQKNGLVIAKPSSNNTRDDSTHRHHQMVNTEIRLIIFFTAKDGEALYSQQKQDEELTAHKHTLLQNSDLN